MKLPALLLLAFATSLPSQADDTSGTSVTTLQLNIANGKGANLRSQSKAIAVLIQAKQLDVAEQKAVELQKTYEAIFDKSLKQYTFQNSEEFQDFRKSTKEKFEWIDWGYKESLQMQAFIAADKRDFPAALALLKTIETIAPISAGTATETGYILNQMGRPKDGLAAYRHAQLLAETYNSQRPYRAAALRGVGYALIDLQQLDEAEKIFLQSLEIEPGNKIALNEIEYIRQQRQKK